MEEAISTPDATHLSVQHLVTVFDPDRSQAEGMTNILVWSRPGIRGALGLEGPWRPSTPFAAGRGLEFPEPHKQQYQEFQASSG